MDDGVDSRGVSEEFLKDVAGIKNPGYATKMLFISNYLMARDDRRRREKRRKT